MLLDHELPRVRAQALRALAVAGTPSTSSWCADRLEDEDEAVRRQAERALTAMAQNSDRIWTLNRTGARVVVDEAFYSHARLYDLMFPGGGPAVDFYRADADRQGGRVLELGCGTGHKLIPIASDGHPCVGLDFSSDMLAEAQRKANERGVAVEWMQGDMRAFDLGRTFDFVFITANSLLHLHEAEDLVSCFRSVRRHLAPGARFVFDVFNPSVRLLAEADGVRRTRESLSFMDPDRGNVSVDVAEIYDAPAQVTRGTWHLSTDSEPDFVVAPLEIRSIFPQELPLLVSLGGLRLVERFGDWSGRPFAVDTPLQLCVCESA